MGSALAVEKGRAANRELLTQCQRSAALQLASGIAWRQRRVEGARNAADYVSRAADRGLLQPGQVWRGPRGRLPSGRPPDHSLKRPSSQPRASTGTSGGPSSTACTASAPPPSCPTTRSSCTGPRGFRPPPGLGPPRALPVLGGQPSSQTAPSSRSGSRGLCSPPGLGPPLVLPVPGGPARRGPRRGRRFFLEVFSGEGYLTGAVLEAGLRIGVPLDLKQGPHFDITDPRVQKSSLGGSVPELFGSCTSRPLARGGRLLGRLALPNQSGGSRPRASRSG